MVVKLILLLSPLPRTSGTPPPPLTTGPGVTLPDTVLGVPLVLGNGESSKINFTTTGLSDQNADVKLTATSDPGGLNLTLSRTTIPAPGVGEASLTVGAGPSTPPGDYRVTITATSLDQTSSQSFLVSVLCDPPQILGLDQPKGVTIARGGSTTLTVKATGTGPFTYQWYSGHAGHTSFPLAGGNSASLSTSTINDNTDYWVRISNACGSVDSQTATVAVQGSPQTRPHGH